MTLIAITQRVAVDPKTHERRDVLSQQWAVLLEQLDMLPLIIPNKSEHLKKLLKAVPVDGILLTGGNDLTVTNSKNCPSERDKAEQILLSYSLTNHIPLIGICRGMQFIAQVFGGKFKKIQGHVGKRHSLIISEESRYKNELRKLGKVNSYHKYAPSQVSKEFIISTKSPDGIIEAIEHKKYPIFGQMWHPEREQPFSGYQLKIIQKVLAGYKKRSR